jgi:hypothetical protein
MMQKTVQPCLLCDAPTEIPVEEWCSKEAPIAICDECSPYVEAGMIAWPLVQMTYVMRCQIAKMMNELDITKTQIGQLFSAQKDLEQDILRRRA